MLEDPKYWFKLGHTGLAVGHGSVPILAHGRGRQKDQEFRLFGYLIGLGLASA